MPNENLSMFVNDFDNEVIVSVEGELVAFLNRRLINNSNFFILTFTESGFPQLSVFVKKDICVIYFMNGEDNFVSIGGNDDINKTETFYENSLGGSLELSCQCIVSTELMIKASKEFFQTKTLPTCIEWMEL